MSRHCRECGKLMQLRHGTIRRAGGYHCINRNCPKSDLFRYRTITGDVMIGAMKAMRLWRAIE